MRAAIVICFMLLVVIGWGAFAGGQTPPASAQKRLTLIPTAFEELNELRVNTGEKAVLADGTMNAVYVKKIPAAGSTYLNFHVDVASNTGPFVLHSQEISLQGAATRPATLRAAFKKGETVAQAPATASYTPMDWFIDTGAAEVRGESLTVNNKALVQFTIEVPRAGLEDLILFVRSQRIGTVREIRTQIARDRGHE